ncbi:MAG TPA: hypothetical protein EYP98_07810, partial [Planctomycetes bacterium]|nr:hypothetical protein [Planctomycetota bacterium]
RFREAAFLAGLASTDWTWSVLFGDLDHDTRVDLFATNGIARFDLDPDLMLRVNKLWAQGQRQAAIAVIQNVAAVPEKNLALRNGSDLSFAKMGSAWGLDLEAVSHGAALADFDGDGDLDVLVNNFEAPATLYENRTTDGNSIIVRLRGQRSERFGVGARVVAQLPNGQRIVRELSRAERSAVTLETLSAKLAERSLKEVKLILKADAMGSLEPMRKCLDELATSEVRVNLVHSGLGGINKADVDLAATSGAVIVGFNTVADANVRALADESGVDIRYYSVIYAAIEDIEAALKGMLKPEYEEVQLGTAEIREVFRSSKFGNIAGSIVRTGLIRRNSSARLVRDGTVV